MPEAREQRRRSRTQNGKPFKKLPGTARTILVASERATTLMDFLYELRSAGEEAALKACGVGVAMLPG